MVEEVSEVPHEATEAVGKAIEMLVVDYGTIIAMDQAASRVCEASSKASDGHSDHVERVTMLPMRRGKSLRRHCP